MAQTPLSSSGSLLPVSEFLKRCDQRTVADLCADDGERVDTSTLSSNVNLLAALLDASGEVEAAAMHGARYAPVDLAAIVATESAARGRLYRMVARLTVGYLYERRPDRGEPGAAFEAALKQLEELRQGLMIFGTVESAGAMTQDHEVETAAVVEARDGTSYQAARFFGRRTNRFDRRE